MKALLGKLVGPTHRSDLAQLERKRDRELDSSNRAPATKRTAAKRKQKRKAAKVARRAQRGKG